MNENSTVALIVPENFIQATRDSGYKNLGSALAELIDNAFEAKANTITVAIEKPSPGAEELCVSVADNGRGMDAETLRHSLRFGWSSRFNQRDGHGRYGMGLPNASLSHSRRVEVWSSNDGKHAAVCRLDVDDVVLRGSTISAAEPVALTVFSQFVPSKRGTVVLWTQCDRLANRKPGPLAKRLRAELGRLFRYQLWGGKRIVVNGELVAAFDPLFIREGTNLTGAQSFGPELSYELELPPGGPRRTSTVKVVFSELPIRQWRGLSNTEKNERGIAKNAGVSIVRAGREIDRGWFFMGQKRKENYDDWWRCEVRFMPELDELFGVTHTKQEIHPTDKLLAILVPDVERIARELNGRARRAFLGVKGDVITRESERVAESHDRLLEPPTSSVQVNDSPIHRDLQRGNRGRVGGLEYRLRFEKLDNATLYEPAFDGVRVTVLLNENHPLVHSFFHAHPGVQIIERSRRDFELLILAAARSELTLSKQKRAKPWITEFRQTWSRTLAAFLG